MATAAENNHSINKVDVDQLYADINNNNINNEPDIKKQRKEEKPPTQSKDTSSARNITNTTGSSSESLAQLAQSIIDEMEMKRKNDEAIISEFRKMMELQTDSMCSTLQQSFGKLYQTTNETCQEKLQKLYNTLGRISQLEQELLTFKDALKMLYSEVETSS